MNRRETFTPESVDVTGSPVLSPKRTVPSPGKETTGLIPASYKKSCCAGVGFNSIRTRFRIRPLVDPAGENHGLKSRSVRTIHPATSGVIFVVTKVSF